MTQATHGIVETIMNLPLFRAEWVLWLLLGISLLSLAVMLERYLFYRRRRIDIDQLRPRLSALLDKGDYEAAATLLGSYDSLPTNVVLFGLRDHHKGPDSVEDLLAAATRRERARFERRLSVLATVASNAPFIGLFGTVLGIIRAFKDLAGDMAGSSNAVMAGISEALVATAVGLLVAIPALVAFNFFKQQVKDMADSSQLLASALTSQLKSVETAESAR